MGVSRRLGSSVDGWSVSFEDITSNIISKTFHTQNSCETNNSLFLCLISINLRLVLFIFIYFLFCFIA